MSLHSSCLIIATLVALCSSNERLSETSLQINKTQCSVLKYGKQDSLKHAKDYVLGSGQISGMFVVPDDPVALNRRRLPDDGILLGLRVEACTAYDRGRDVARLSLIDPVDPYSIKVEKVWNPDDVSLTILVDYDPRPIWPPRG